MEQPGLQLTLVLDSGSAAGGCVCRTTGWAGLASPWSHPTRNLGQLQYSLSLSSVGSYFCTCSCFVLQNFLYLSRESQSISSIGFIFFGINFLYFFLFALMCVSAEQLIHRERWNPGYVLCSGWVELGHDRAGAGVQTQPSPSWSVSFGMLSWLTRVCASMHKRTHTRVHTCF